MHVYIPVQVTLSELQCPVSGLLKSPAVGLRSWTGPSIANCLFCLFSAEDELRQYKAIVT